MDDVQDISDGHHTFGELYEHRHWLFIALMQELSGMAWASKKHYDGSSLPGWFIAGINLSTGQISYHLPDRLWDDVVRIGVDLNNPPEWDGHDSDEVLNRLQKLCL